jgi:hypothetical protein
MPVGAFFTVCFGKIAQYIFQNVLEVDLVSSYQLLVNIRGKAAAGLAAANNIVRVDLK